jgi:hypothetical protein
MYLNCNLNLSIPEENNDWVFIKKMHKIRKLIVHYNSSLIDIKKEKLDINNFERLIKTHKNYKLIRSFSDSIELDELTGKFYIIDVALLSKYLDCINSFLNFVIAKHLA